MVIRLAGMPTPHWVFVKRVTASVTASTLAKGSASVLLAYCESSSSLFGLTPVEVTSTVPRFRHARRRWERAWRPERLHMVRLAKKVWSSVAQRR